MIHVQTRDWVTWGMANHVMPDLVDFLVDVKSNDSTKIPRELVSFGKMDEISKISKDIQGYSIFDSDQIQDFEEKYFKMIQRAHKGKLKADSGNPVATTLLIILSREMNNSTFCIISTPGDFTINTQKYPREKVHLKRKEKRIIYHFGNGYRFGRDEDEEAKLRNQKDISPS